MEYDRLRYLVLVNPPAWYELSRSARDSFFQTGNVLDVRESSMYSVQPNLIENVERRPTTLVLVNMGDRYGEAARRGFEIIEAKDVGDALSYCRDKRPIAKIWTDDDGTEHPYTEWVPAASLVEG